ncbi:MAG: hypothetical protein ACJ76F_14025 [Bacteroidia bacterium]
MRLSGFILLCLVFGFTLKETEKKYILRGEEVYTDIFIGDHAKCLEYVYEYDMVHVDSISHLETDKLLHIVVLNKDSLKAGKTYDIEKTKNLHLDYSTFVHLNRCWYKKLQGTVRILKMSSKDHLSMQLKLSACRIDTSAPQKIIDQAIKW